MKNLKIWLVTGASQGLGLSLVKKLLETGYHVAAATRNIERLIKEVGAESDTFLPMEIDVTKLSNAKSAVDQTTAKFGTLDVLVNNAGYGQTGAVAELTDEEIRQVFDVNFYSQINFIRETMPILKAKKSGHIFNISSIAGYTGQFPGLGIYSATKFAIAGMSEAVSEEGKNAGVIVTTIYPGAFRTNFFEKTSIRNPLNPDQDYDDIHQAQLQMQGSSGHQEGDPQKLAEVLIQVTAMENPPLHLFLGADSLQIAREKLKSLELELERYEDISVSTGFDSI
jgi:NAD(P)-dependent dehydrogenase (short-subunit alcohol dehydrogenase family)